jgi:hypothetical protein
MDEDDSEIVWQLGQCGTKLAARASSETRTRVIVLRNSAQRPFKIEYRRVPMVGTVTAGHRAEELGRPLRSSTGEYPWWYGNRVTASFF